VVNRFSVDRQTAIDPYFDLAVAFSINLFEG